MAAPAKLCPLCGVHYDAAATFCQKDGARLTTEGEEDPFLGKMLLDQFRIEEAIGAGGMGTVYRARQTSLNRDVAIKILHSELTRNPDAVRRFRREAKVATQLEHPNLVRVFLFGELPKTQDNPDGGLYLAMEYLDGRSMMDLMREEGPLPVPRALHLILQTAGAIGAAHAQGIVHRDVKPENIIVLKKHGDPDFVKVLDFGIARLLWGEQTALTQSGVIFGTARYISPEGASGEPTDARSDVYSLGVLAYQLLTGVTPFEASTPVAMLMKHIHEEAPDLRRMGLGGQVPQEVADVVMRCLAKNPDMRWDDASQLAAALTLAAQQANVMMPSARRSWSMTPAADSSFGTTVPGLGRPKKRRGPSPLALVAAFVLGATAVTGGALLLKEAFSEEYLDSEKYEIHHWKLNQPHSLKPVISRVNRIRRENPALQQTRNLMFHPVDREEIICYSKWTDDYSNIILVAANLDPHHTHATWLYLPFEEMGVKTEQTFQMHELVSNARYMWHAGSNYLELDPHTLPVQIFRLRRRVRSENDFDYFM